MKPATVLIRAFQIHIGRPGKFAMRAAKDVVFATQYGCVRTARVKPDIQRVAIFLVHLRVFSAQ